jgi:hypothetical protein
MQEPVQKLHNCPAPDADTFWLVSFLHRRIPIFAMDAGWFSKIRAHNGAEFTLTAGPG